MRDIDQLISAVRELLPEVQCTQLFVSHPGVDDDGLWFFRIPGRQGDVQVESSDGALPFLIEFTFRGDRLKLTRIDEAVAKIVAEFQTLK